MATTPAYTRGRTAPSGADGARRLAGSLDGAIPQSSAIGSIPHRIWPHRGDPGVRR
jgi:hypothetical protein